MTVPKLKHRDIESVERARRDSSNSSSSSDGSPPRVPDELPAPLLPLRTPSPTRGLFDLAVHNILLDPSNMGGKKNRDSSSPCSDDVCHRFFIWKLRLLHTAMAVVLAYVGLQQTERHDAAVWMALFLIPAILTMLSTIKIQLVDGVCVRSLVSVYLGSALCLFFWLLTSLLVAVVQQSETHYPSYNPLDYQQGREALAVAVCVGWQKFHLVTTKEQIKVTRFNKSYRPSSDEGVSARAMIRKIIPLLLLPGSLAAFCYIDSVNEPIVTTAHAIRKAVM